MAEKQTGAQLIAAERERQVSVEGWTPQHDDEHELGTLLSAAECYLRSASYGHDDCDLTRNWPWDAKWWKPSDDPVRNLTKAGALIAAEIDRLLRARGK